jgi:aspartyl-tRNA(Asn)/glutamyl-tRNA(Gln) amidotransferase subunit A
MGSGSIDSIFEPVKNLWRSGVPYTLDGGLPLLNCETFIPETGCIAYGDWCIAGGSSGGSATAVASGVCAVALGAMMV